MLSAMQVYLSAIVELSFSIIFITELSETTLVYQIIGGGLNNCPRGGQ